MGICLGLKEESWAENLPCRVLGCSLGFLREPSGSEVLGACRGRGWVLLSCSSV